MNRISHFICLSLFVGLALGTAYLHNPRGSNNRCAESTATRTNGYRLFDSQNNARGGYNRGDKYSFSAGNKEQIGSLSYYEGSILNIEFAVQHGCNNGKTKCDIIIQYACSASMRDCLTTDTADEVTDNQRTGMHEDRAYYAKCKARQRNKRLWVADKSLGDTAIYTRQNVNGTRYGFECPEERDYYPYWHSTPFVDIAVLTSEPERCSYYKSQSQNVIAKNDCSVSSANNQNDCIKAGGTWTSTGPVSPNNPPYCGAAPFIRENNLGNGNPIPGFFSHFNWTLPKPNEMCTSTSCNCFLRLRYNVTSSDVDFNDDYTSNGNNGPFKNQQVDTNLGVPLNLAIKTSQIGRIFQDRTHLFKVIQRPSTMPANVTIHNLGVRGKRGNIVQTFPSIEYDFTPQTLHMNSGDYVHIQWTGSNTHNNGGNGGDGQTGDDGQGNGGTDRHNMVQIAQPNSNFPLYLTRNTLFKQDGPHFVKGTDGRDVSVEEFPAFYASCGIYPYNKVDQLLNNCGATFDGGLLRMTKPGAYHYMCTRNNNFTNRSQKGKIIVLAQ